MELRCGENREASTQPRLSASALPNQLATTLSAPDAVARHSTQATWRSSGDDGGHSRNQVTLVSLYVGHKQERSYMDATEPAEDKDTTVVGNHRLENVGANQTIIIGGNRTDTVKGNEAVTVGVTRSITVGADQTLSIGGDRTISVNGGDGRIS